MGMTCDEAYDACMADPQPADDDGNCADEIDDLSECTDVTVAETEACISAQWAQQAEMFAAMAAMTCDDIEASMEEPSDEDMDMNEEPELPAECVGLEEKCPVFFADDEDHEDHDDHEGEDHDDHEGEDHEGEDHEDHDDDDMGDM